jgi:hypothetical protein
MRALGFIAGALVTGLVVWATGIHSAASDDPRVEFTQIEEGRDHGAMMASLPDSKDPQAPPPGPAEPPGPTAMIDAEEESLTDGPSADADQLAPTSTVDRSTGLPPVILTETDTPVLPAETLPRLEQGDAPQSVGAEGPLMDATHPGDSPLQEGQHDDRWLAFFTPFRSEASAQGFAQHLESATCRRFRVTRAGPGDYRVEFRMVADENEGQRIEQIEAASGLALRAGRL